MAVAFRKLSGYRVYCDESNTDGNKRHPVYGAILVALDDLPTVQREIKEWRDREGMHSELKWHKVDGVTRLAKYKSLVDLLFSLARHHQLVQFKAIILDRHAPEYRTYSKGNDEIGFYKTYYHWLLWHFAEFPLKHRCKLRVIIDDRTLPKNAKDPFTKLKFALNNGIRKELDATADDVVTEVKPLDSEQSDLLQVADVLMGHTIRFARELEWAPVRSSTALDPVSWTSSERWIGCPEPWQTRPSAGARAGSPMMTSKPRPCG